MADRVLPQGVNPLPAPGIDVRTLIVAGTRGVGLPDRKTLKEMVRLERFELPAFWFVVGKYNARSTT